MNKNQLYDIETKLYRDLDNIKKEQKQYAAGVEKGIDMTVSAIRKGLNAESRSSANDCIYCHFENDVGANFSDPDDFKIIRSKDDSGKYNYSLATNEKRVFRTCNIRFCPLCGRLLEKEETE